MTQGRYQTQIGATGANLPGNATETILVTTPVLMLPFDTGLVLLIGYFGATVGTGTTAWRWRIRQGTTLSSPIVTTSSVDFTVVAGNSSQIIAMTSDTLPGNGGTVYSLSVFAIGATGATANGFAEILAMVL